MAKRVNDYEKMSLFQKLKNFFKEKNRSKEENKALNMFNESINFDIPGFERPRDIQELNHLKNRIELYDKLYSIMHGEAKYNDVLKVATIIVEDLGDFQTIPPEILPGNLEYTEDSKNSGAFSSSFGVMFIAYGLLESISSGKSSIISLFSTIGHEVKHAEQANACGIYYSLSDEDKSKVDDLSKQIYKDYGKEQIKEEELYAITKLLEMVCEDQEIERINNMSLQEKKEFFTNISYANYLSFAHEVDAREAGIIFAVKISNQIMNDPLCPEDVKQWLYNQKEEVDKLLLVETQFRELQKLYSDFKKHVENIDVSLLGDLEEKIIEMSHIPIMGGYGEEDKTEIIKKEEASRVVNVAYGKIVEIILETKSADEQIKLFEKAIKMGHVSFANSCASSLRRNLNANQQQISQMVTNLLASKLSNERMYYSDIVEYVAEKDLQNLTTSLFKQDRVNDAIGLVQIVTGYLHNQKIDVSKKTVINILDIMADYLNDIVKNLDKKKNNITYLEYSRLSFFMQLFCDYVNRHEFDAKHLKLLTDLKNKMIENENKAKEVLITDRDESYEFIAQKYGKERAERQRAADNKLVEEKIQYKKNKRERSTTTDIVRI